MLENKLIEFKRKSLVKKHLYSIILFQNNRLHHIPVYNQNTINQQKNVT